MYVPTGTPVTEKVPSFNVIAPIFVEVRSAVKMMTFANGSGSPDFASVTLPTIRPVWANALPKATRITSDAVSTNAPADMPVRRFIVPLLAKKPTDALDTIPPCNRRAEREE